MRRRIALLVKAAVSVTLLALLARSLNLRDALDALKSVPLSAWIFNVLLVGAATALGAFRWHLAAGRQIPLATCTNYYWMGIFYSYVLPGSLVGDLARTTALAVNAPRYRSVSLVVSVFLDRLGGLTTIILILVLACAGMWWTHVDRIWLVLGVALAFAVQIMLPPLLLKCLRQVASWSWLPAVARRMLGDAILATREITLPVWWRMVVLSLLIHLITCFSYAWGARVTHVPEEMWRVALYYAVFNLVMLLPITIAGVGLREQCALWLFGREGAVGVASVALSWFVLATTLVHVLIGALLHLKHSFSSRSADSDIIRKQG